MYQALRIKDIFGVYRFDDVPYNIQVANVGSSHAFYALDYSDYEENTTCFNFSMPTQYPSYDYRILEQYLDHLADGGVMILPISYFTLFNAGEDRAGFEEDNLYYYLFLNKEYIINYSILDSIKAKYFEVLRDRPDDVISNIIKGIKAHGEIVDSYDVGGPDYDYQNDAVKAHDRHYYGDEHGRMTVVRSELDSVYDIIALCRERNIRLILITTPYRREYNDLFDDDFYEQFYAAIDEIVWNTGCEYYDYSHDARFQDSDRYMRNADHVSAEGSKVFTQIVMDDIVKISS